MKIWILTTLFAATTSAALATKADILVMGLDKKHNVLLALTDTPCTEQAGKVAAAYGLASKKTFVGCWVGWGKEVTLTFPTLKDAITYDVRMFTTVNNDLRPIPGGIIATL